MRIRTIYSQYKSVCLYLIYLIVLIITACDSNIEPPFRPQPDYSENEPLDSILCSDTVPIIIIDSTETIELIIPDFAVEQKSRLIGAAGIKIEEVIEQRYSPSVYECSYTLQADNIVYQACKFQSAYDNWNIWFYVLYPNDYNLTKKHKSLVLFSGHGRAGQLIQIGDSYQKAAALALAKEGYLVFVMENRGMGRLIYMGDHIDILDKQYKEQGSSWYGAIITDALSLLNLVFDRSDVDSDNVAVAGVSTGGALSFFSSIFDERIKITYVQGYFGDFQRSFCDHPTIHKCNSVFCLLSAHKLALNIYPRELIVVNGTADQFYEGSDVEFSNVSAFYDSLNMRDRAFYYSPEGVPHEFTLNYAQEHFDRSLIQDQPKYAELPQLVEPYDNAENTELMPKFIWQKIDIAQFYQFELSLDSDFRNSVAYADSLTDNSIQVDSLSSNETYYWRVRAGNAGGLGHWSIFHSFTTIP